MYFETNYEFFSNFFFFFPGLLSSENNEELERHFSMKYTPAAMMNYIVCFNIYIYIYIIMKN